jgi:uncharacterized protein YkwD
MIAMSKTKLSHFFIPHHKNDYRAHFLKPIAFHTVIIFLLALQLVFSSIKTFSPQVLGVAYSITEDDIISQTNDRRGKNGLLPLRKNGQLSTAAALKGQDMLAKGYWAHTSPDGKEPWYFINQAGYSYTRAGENLARDFRDTTSVVNAWMDSPGHKANLLNPNYQEIGVSVVSGPFNGYEAVIVVQMFGQPSVSSVAGALSQPQQVAASTPKPAVGRELALRFENPATSSATSSGNIPQLTKPEGAQTQIISDTEPAPLIDPQNILRAVVIGAGIFFTVLLLVDAVIIAKQRIRRDKHGHSVIHAVFLLLVVISLLVVQSGLIL